ncbi:putative P450 monooxygenase [Piedraia hortae CBS 480.64]|uniref:Putative P450 monooxygenase n=1 Tax=Piedraia hortae CBS 480.64 TaxID=1314780 RepID=A0A6A7C3M6_9PEZI|nr:putative P450 monooxygenase [Piedraia hortae CBS 480.64]
MNDFVLRLPIFLLIAFICYQTYNYITLSAKRRAFQRSQGTLPAPWLPGTVDKLIGWNHFRDDAQALQEQRFLSRQQSLYEDNNLRTFQLINSGRHMHLTIEPENLKHVLAIDFKKWGLPKSRMDSFRPFLGDGIFTTNGTAWSHSREMLRPNFVRAQIGDLSMFEVHITHLITSLPTDGSTVDLSERFFRLTMDSATEFLFGESTNSLLTQNHESFSTSFNRGQDHIARSARFGIFAKLAQDNTTWPHDRKFVHDFVDYYVSKGLSKKCSPSERYVFLDELCERTSDPIHIRSELLNILLAGRDTTASLLTNVWHVLSQNQDIFSRLKSEVDALGGAMPSFEQLKQMKYLKAILHECLRLYPVVPGNSREALEDAVLPLGGGEDGKSPIFVPKGEMLGWSVYTMHRRKDLFGEDAEVFRPERWLDEDNKRGLRTGWEFLPFNGGPRICLGQQFALTEASYATVRLCQTFDRVECRDPTPWTENLSLTCRNFNGAKVGLFRD